MKKEKAATVQQLSPEWINVFPAPDSCCHYYRTVGGTMGKPAGAEVVNPQQVGKALSV